MKFRKKLRNVVAVVLLLCLVSKAIKNITPIATEYYTATTTLNVRTGAGMGYPVSFTLKEGDEVELLSKENSWYNVRYSSKTGYAHSKFLKFSRANEIILEPESIPLMEIEIKIFIGILTILAVYILYMAYTKLWEKYSLKRVTKSNRGTPSERNLVLKLLKRGIPAENIFHDLYVEKSVGNFSQVDLVAVSEIGIIVFEVKEYSGWIFGSGNQQTWTKVLNYGKEKHRFYNPIKQNNRHIVELRKKLFQFSHVPFYSVIIFYGDCELKEINFVPNGTFVAKSNRVSEVVGKILKENITVDYIDKSEVLRILKEAVINGGIVENQIIHSENIKDMLGEHRVFD